jgi:hypothetical protein
MAGCWFCDWLTQQVYFGFRVRARNAIGAGAWSDQVTLQTPIVGERKALLDYFFCCPEYPRG